MFTGGPGAGKTTLLTALEARGVEFVPEAAREIIRDRKRRGLPPRPDPADFANEILRLDIERYRAASANPGRILFDRAVPDALCMLDHLGLLMPEEAKQQLLLYRYAKRVFVLPPWEEIYTADGERDQTFGESVEVNDRLCVWYLRCGYELTVVPRATIEERCEFVLRTLDT